MHIMYFTERPYLYVPEDEVLKIQSFFGVPNRHFDPAKGAKLLNEYLDDKVLAEELGFDGVMLNEHHGTPFCMGAVMDMEASILARITKKVRIVLLGNPLPVVANPLRLAEELAMIDMISGGRLVPGWVRGAGSEQLANNANPAYNREYFNEAHDLVIAAWTRPGPFRWEGKHFHYRFVNPWAKPLQKKPPIWIPGVISPETVVWAAEHGYPYVALATELQATAHMWNLYGETAAKAGYQVGPENFGYFQKLIVADSDEEAYELGKGHIYGGSFTPTRFAVLPGYNSKDAVRNYATKFYAAVSPKMSHQDDKDAQRKALLAHYDKLHESGHIITGTPKTVLPKLRRVLETLRPGILTVWGPEGPVPPEKTLRMMELMGKEVLPVLREFGKEFDLTDPFQKEPGTRPLPAGGKWEPLVKAQAA